MPKKSVPILDDDDQERLEELDIAVRRAKARVIEARAAAVGVSQRLGDEDAAGEAEEAVRVAEAEFDQFLDEAAKRGEEWLLQSIGHEAFRDLLKEHPARTETRTDAEGNNVTTVDPEDEGWGVNTETFPKALLMFADPDDNEHRTILKVRVKERNVSAAREVEKRVRRLSEGQFTELWTAAYVLNKRGVTDPKSARFSLSTLRSSET